jgi:hypothetical protein
VLCVSGGGGGVLLLLLEALEVLAKSNEREGGGFDSGERLLLLGIMPGN